MNGGFVLVVGPSGAGKDTLLGLARAELKSHERFVFPRRLVTRPSSIWEDHDTIPEADFTRDFDAGTFALAWRAHGLGYAIPGACLTLANAGQMIVCNVSRTVIGEARERLLNVSVVEVTAPRETLAARIAGRARSDDGDVDTRITRSEAVGATNADFTIINDRSPAEGARLLVDYLWKKARDESCSLLHTGTR